MKKLRKYYLFIFFFILFSGSGIIEGADKIHPMNKAIIGSMHFKGYKLKWPLVPRILAEQALLLYRSNKALFIKVGVDGGVVRGALHGKKMHLANPRKLAEIAKKRVIIVYCG